MKKTLLFKYVSCFVKYSSVLLLLFSMQTESNAQSADYAIKWHHSYDLKDTLTVYMRSSTTINFPFNQVSTSQVTLRVPTGMLPFFDGSDTPAANDSILLHNNGAWANNARFDIGQATATGTLGTHEDGNDYDFISFGLTNLGTRNIEFVAGEELPLFSFLFPSGGLCTDSIPIHILDHVEDTTFMANGITSPNNNMSVLGPGGDIYSGNYFDYGARCYDYDNDDVFNTQDYCDYTLIENIEDPLVTIDSSGCTDFDGDGFHPDDNPTALDQDIAGLPDYDSDGNEDETYNLYDTDVFNKCEPQGDSLRGALSLFYAGAEYSVDTGDDPSLTAPDICAGDTIVLMVNMIETESVNDANDYNAPYDYDHRGVYNITINSSLGGDMTVPMYTSGDSIKITPTEDGTVFSLVQVVDTFLCNAIELDSIAQINVNEGVTLATIDGDANICSNDSVVLEISLVAGEAPFSVTYGYAGNNTSITMTGRDTTITITGIAEDRDYELVSVSDNGGCFTPTDQLIGIGDVDFSASADMSTIPTVTAPSDCNATDGSIVVSTVGHPVGTEYSINNGVTWQTSATFSGLGTGNYVVAARVNNNDNCIAVYDSVFTMASGQAPVFAAVNDTQPTDCTANTGSIEVLVQSTPPSGQVIEYELREGANIITAWNTSNTFSNVAPDTYTVHVRYNASGGGSPQCEVQFPGAVDINGISAPSLGTPLANNATDCTEENGDLSLAASSSNGFALEYQLVPAVGSPSTWGTQNVFTNLPAGDYQINVRNAGAFTNCESITASQTITRPDSLTLSSVATTDVTDCQSTNGSIAITAAGDLGGTNIEYSLDGGATWQGSGTSQTYSDLDAGIYNVAIRNSNDQSCLTLSPVADTITKPEDIIQINPIVTDVADCNTLNTGEILAQVVSSSGDSTIHYTLFDGSSDTDNLTDDNFTGLVGGSYQVIAKYPSGICPDTITAVVESQTPIVASGIATNSQDCGEADGELQITATGEGAIVYTIDTGATWVPTNVFSGLGTTTFEAYVEYADGTCNTLVTGGPFVLTEPVPTDIVVPDVVAQNASMCGVDDAMIIIDTASFSGSNFEFSIDGSTYQADTSFEMLGGGTYLVTVRNSVTPSCFDTVTVSIDDNDAPQLSARAFLQGPYNNSTGLMNDDLRALSVIPMTNPYNSADLVEFGADNTDIADYHNEIDRINPPNGGATVFIDQQDSVAILGDRGGNSVVDWIVVELRPFYDSTVIETRRVALLQRDGDIVEWTDGETPLQFTNTCAASDTTYFVSLKHRNHLGVMTANPIAFDADVVNLDFTENGLDLYRKPGLTVEPMATVGGTRALWGGNVAFNRRILFQGNNPDSGLIGNKVSSHTDNTDALANFILKGYYNTDVNMDGVTIFQGAPNDVDILFFNIMGNPSNTNFNANFILGEQVPGDGQ